MVIYNGEKFMSALHHEALLEDCFDEAIQSFCESNKLTEAEFAEISNHEGVILAIEKSARQRFEDLCQ